MKLRVAIAFGGVSVEHEISILSAMQAIAAMPDRYETIPLYIAKDGRMYSAPCMTSPEVFKDIENITKRSYEVHMLRRSQQVYLQREAYACLRHAQAIDFVLPILHGTNGEDGSFQGFLKTLRIPYAQCDVLAGALGQDKAAMKMVLQDRGLPLVPWFYWWKHQPMEEAFFAKAKRLGYPMLVKPSNLGSSIGITTVHHEDELRQAMEDGFQYDDKIVIEKMITPLREINVSVLGDAKHQRCSVLEEVIKQDEILSYKDKYEKGAKTKGMAGTSRRIPAMLSEDEQEEIKGYATACFCALQAEGVVRIDFLMQEDTGDIYVNEINSIPGSLAYYLWEHSGMSFSELLTTLIEQGIHRWRNQQKKIMSFDTNILQLQGKGIKK